MHYILVTELETTGIATCKVQGFPESELISLEMLLTSLDMSYSKEENIVEACWKKNTDLQHVKRNIDKFLQLQDFQPINGNRKIQHRRTNHTSAKSSLDIMQRIEEEKTLWKIKLY